MSIATSIHKLTRKAEIKLRLLGRSGPIVTELVVYQDGAREAIYRTRKNKRWASAADALESLHFDADDFDPPIPLPNG